MAAFDNEACMFFVGGNDVKANNDAAGVVTAGGCTKAWWINEIGGLKVGDAGYDAAAQTAMGKLMADASGSPYELENFLVTEISSSGNGYVTIAEQEDIWTYPEVGMLMWMPADVFVEGEGIYKVIAKVPAGYRIEGIPDGGLQIDDELATLYFGGAHEKIEDLAQEISAAAHSQEIFCNKDYIPEDWNFTNWGYGDFDKNTWLRVRGFNRVPHDITDRRGSSYESLKDAEDNGSDPTTASWVNLDLNTRANTFIEPDDGENIQISGFRFYNQATDQLILIRAANSYSNLDISHNAFKLSYDALDFRNGGRLVIFDNYFYTGIALNPGAVLNLQSSGIICIAFNRFAFRDLQVLVINKIVDAFIFGNYGVANWSIVRPASTTGFTVQAFNTWLNGGNASGFGMVDIYDGLCFSLANIIMPKTVDDTAFIIQAVGGSIISKNDCLYSEGSGTPAPLTTIMGNLSAGGEADSFEFEIEEDPEIVDGLPENKNIRLTDSYDQWRWIGAVNVTPDLPDAENVTEDDTVDDVAGTFAVPAVGDVEEGVGYGAGGTELTGTYHETQENEVAAGITFGANGTEYTGTRTELTPPSPSGDVEASGETSKAMAALKDMLSESAAFQDAIGATGDAAAKKAWALSRIHLAEYLRDDDEEDGGGFARPFGLIMTPGGDTSRAIATGQFANSGLLDLMIEQEIPEAYQPDDQQHNAEMYFKNFIDGVIKNCTALSSQPGYLMVQSMTMPEGPGRIDEKNVKAYGCRIAVAWGLE